MNWLILVTTIMVAFSISNAEDGAFRSLESQRARDLAETRRMREVNVDQKADIPQQIQANSIDRGEDLNERRRSPGASIKPKRDIPLNHGYLDVQTEQRDEEIDFSDKDFQLNREARAKKKVAKKKVSSRK